VVLLFFRFVGPSPPRLYPLSLHDALPISSIGRSTLRRLSRGRRGCVPTVSTTGSETAAGSNAGFASSAGSSNAELPEVSLVVNRSEEHTSELQSRENLVCRLLLEKKKTNT